MLQRLGVGGLQVSLLDDRIIWQLRMPRVLGAAAVGAALACSGAVLQALTRNDLVDPYLLGISGGAAAGAVTVIVLGVSLGGLMLSTSLTLAAFVGALLALAVVLAVATGRGGSLSPTRTVLAGLAVAQLAGAYVALLVVLKGEGDAARRVLTWTLGSFAGLREGSAYFVASCAIVSTVLLLTFSERLDAFAFGETSAGPLAWTPSGSAGHSWC